MNATIQSRKRCSALLFAALACILLQGCQSNPALKTAATQSDTQLAARRPPVSPYEGAAAQESDAALRTMFNAADYNRQTHPESRLLFAGFAMHSQSGAFRGDVEAMTQKMREIDPNAITFTLDNPMQGQVQNWPLATGQNIVRVLQKVADMARPQDRVVLLFSSHGNVDILSINFADQYFPYITPANINGPLSKIKAQPTLILLSSCHSGSFIPALARDNRVIVTASAADRSSFGCQPSSQSTYFVDALVSQPDWGANSIESLMDRARKTISVNEKFKRISPPSSPQIFVGQGVEAFAKQPLLKGLGIPAAQ